MFYCVYIQFGKSKVSNTAQDVHRGVIQASHIFKKSSFHWLFTTVVYQQIENNERANQIHRFTIDHCKFILMRFSRNPLAIYHKCHPEVSVKRNYMEVLNDE